MGVVAALRSKKLVPTKLFTVLNDSNIGEVVDHIEKLSEGKVIRTRWLYEVGNRLTLNFYMGLDWNYEIEHTLSQRPQTPIEITKYNSHRLGLDVWFDKESPAFLYSQRGSEGSALGMYLERTYFRLRKVKGKLPLMIAELDEIEPLSGGEGGRYRLRKELWMRA